VRRLDQPARLVVHDDRHEEVPDIRDVVRGGARGAAPEGPRDVGDGAEMRELVGRGRDAPEAAGGVRGAEDVHYENGA
jgi:hypothetical protein